jgi:hypothetical protein
MSGEISMSDFESSAGNSFGTSTDFHKIRQRLLQEKAFFTIEKQQASEVEKKSYESIKSLIFLTRNIFSLHLSITKQFKNEQFFYNEIEVSQTNSASLSGPIQKQFHEIIQSYLSNPSAFAQSIESFLLNNSEYEQEVIFSLIPAFYSSFWSQEEYERFYQFFQNLTTFQFSFSKLFISHPSFYIFFSSFQNVLHGNLNQVFDLMIILNLVKARCFLFPSYFRNILINHPEPLNFFVNYFLHPLLTFPSLYGLVEAHDETSLVFLIKDIPNYVDAIQDILQLLQKSDEFIQVLPSESTFERIISDNTQLLYFFRTDLILLCKISGRNIDIPQNLDFFQISYRKVFSCAKTSTENDSSISLESLLRDLVIQLDISKLCQNIIETLKFALSFHASASKLALELNLDDFKHIKDQSNAPDDNQYYIQLLEDAYESRQNTRRGILSTSTTNNIFKVQILQCNRAIQFLQQIRQINCLRNWNQNELFNTLVSRAQTLFGNPSEFKAIFSLLTSTFSNFCKQISFQFSLREDMKLIYSKMTQILNLKEFRLHFPQFVEVDNKIKYMIENYSGQLLEKITDKALQTFISHPEIMDLSRYDLLTSFQENSVIPICLKIDKALNSLSHLLSFQGITEIGADQIFPLTIILYIYSNPPSICTVAEYLKRCFLSLESENPFPQTLQYNATQSFTVYEHFKNHLKDYGL